MERKLPRSILPIGKLQALLTLLAWMLGGCAVAFNNQVTTLLNDETSDDGSQNAALDDFYLDLGTLSAVTLHVPWNGETNKISALYESETRFTGECGSGNSVHIFDSTSGALLKTTTCASGVFDTTVDFTSYADGAVNVKLTQSNASKNTSSSHVSVAFTKETEYCKDPAHLDDLGNGNAGTVGDPHLICTAPQLVTLFINANRSHHFHLKNDIDVQGETALKGLFPGGGNEFTGVLDGRSFGLYNYDNDRELIQSTWTGAIIRDLKLRDVNVTFAAATKFAVLVRSVAGAGTFERISITGNVTIPDPAAFGDSGLLFGFFYNSTLTDSWARVSVQLASMSIIHKFGMLVGRMDDGTTLSGCHAHGEITGSGGSLIAGGLVGNASQFWGAGASAITNSYSTATIKNTKYSGGIIGESRPSTSLTISNSYFSGELWGDHGTGGLVGVSNTGPTHIVNSYAEAKLSQPGSCIGGLAGSLHTGSTVVRSYFSGQVEVTGSFAPGAGGIAGCTGGAITITDSYALGEIQGDNQVGGLLGGGNNGSTINTSYYRGTVFTNGSSDAISTDTAITVNDVYYDVDQASTVTASTGIPTPDFASATNFPGFTFDATHWVMGEERPVLYWE